MFSSQNSQVSSAANYIEDVFSTYLYTGNGGGSATGYYGTQTITNGIDLSTKGGLVWVKSRSRAVSHRLADTARGVNNLLRSDSTGAQQTGANTITAFNTTGFNLGSDSDDYGTNTYGETFASWTFRKQPKFFDVVTFSTTNSANARISHNLGSVPAFYVIKRVDGAGGWFAYHGSLGRSSYLQLQSTNASASSTDCWGTSDPTTTDFGVNEQFFTNGTVGLSYIAYVFASNAGGFGLTGTDNVISCGSFTTNSNGEATVSLGYEPQWMIAKRTDSTGNWFMIDTMRGWNVSGNNDVALFANTSAAEVSGSNYGNPTATGFFAEGGFANSATYIYIAIRRGPMKVPTSGTSVYNNLANRVGTSATATISGVGFPVDLMIPFNETSGSSKPFVDRLRGATKYLLPPYSNAEQTDTDVVTSFASNDGVIVGADATLQVINNYYNSSRRYAASFFRRAPSFFDEVCYTGTGTGSRAVTHNLGVAPEMVIVKQRTGTPDHSWWVLTTAVPLLNILNSTEAANNSGVPANLFGDSTYNNYIAPTATTVTLSPSDEVNKSGNTYVQYLFATCTGVSKVGSYTGTGALQTVNCGFTSGARFILIKRTDSTGNWYLYDSARGITSGNDPYLLLNTTGTSELDTNYVDTDSTGFKVTAAAPAELNANGGNFIFLAIS